MTDTLFISNEKVKQSIGHIKSVATTYQNYRDNPTAQKIYRVLEKVIMLMEDALQFP